MIQHIEAKSILSKLKREDSWFGITWNMNLYRGCQHGCIYCDTRSECYGIHDISSISVKKNALELLSKELLPKRKNRATIGTGSMNDPYMPLEKELQLTRKALDKDFAGYKEKYQARFGEQYECFSPNYKMLSHTFNEQCAIRGIESRMRFYRPEVYEQASLF